MEEDFFLALCAASVSALSAALHSWRILAKHGLLDPDDLDGMVHDLTIPFDEAGDGVPAKKMRSVWEAVLDPEMAEILRLAETTWRGPRA